MQSAIRVQVQVLTRRMLMSLVLILISALPVAASALQSSAPQDSVTVTFEVVVPEDTPDGDTVFWAGSLNSWDPGADATGFGAQDKSIPLEPVGGRTWRMDVSAPANEEVQYNYTRGTIFRVEGAPDYTHPEMRSVIFDAPKTIRDTVAVWRDQPPPALAEQWPRLDLTPADLQLTYNGTPTDEMGGFLSPVDASRQFFDIPSASVAIEALPEGVADPVVYAKRMGRAGTAPPSYLLAIVAEREAGRWDVYIDQERDRRFASSDRVFTLESDSSEARWSGTVPLTDLESNLARRDSLELTLTHVAKVPDQIRQRLGSDVPVFSIQMPYNHRVATLENDTLGVSTQFGTRFSNFFYLTVDRNGDGIAEIGSGSNEVAMLDRQSMYSEQRYFKTPTFRLGDAWWQIADLDPAGTELMLRPAEPTTEQVAIREGGSVPNWEATTLDGTLLSRNALEGKYVLLDFWGSWCAPCITALPKLAAAYERFDRERFEIIGFANESEASLRQTMDAHDITWPQVLDSDGTYSAQFTVRGYPTYYLVGPDGTVVATGSDLRGDNLVDTLESFLE
mgnify:CR=1 FL=1